MVCDPFTIESRLVPNVICGVRLGKGEKKRKNEQKVGEGTPVSILKMCL